MIPPFPKFKPLGLEDIPNLTKHLKGLPRRICELSLGNIYIWADFDRPQLTLVNNDICLLISPPNEPPYFLEPFGRSKIIETTETCLKHAGRISRVSKDYINLLPKGEYKIEPLRNHFDYIYERQKLAELKGKRYDGKRNHIKKFQRRFPGYEFVNFSLSFKKEALELFEKWFAVREESRYFPRLAHMAQKNALNDAFAAYDDLCLMGGALLAEKKLAGFIIGSYLNPEMASVHFAYGNPELPGAAQTLFWEGFNKTFAAYKYVDLEQDLGIPGLRTMKLSYYPLKLEEKFEVKPLS